LDENGRAMNHSIVIAGIPLPSDSPLFLRLVGVHVVFGVVCVVAGAIAMLSRKGRGRHTEAGTIYYWSLSVVFVTSTAIAAMRWAEDYHLFALGLLCFSSASLGKWAQRIRPLSGLAVHIAAMGASYVLLLTAFYLDNGPNLPLWRELPHIAFWLLPAAVGLPLIVYALMRHPLMQTGRRQGRSSTA
jgi:hypothetical protein